MNIPPKYRIPFLFVANLILFIGIWSGLQRLGWRLPFPNLKLSIQHGPLMISGFLGTLISLERAVALKNYWSYLAPALMGVGSLLLIILPEPGVSPYLLILSGGVLFILISIVIIRKFPIFPAFIIGSGVLLLFIGNVLWFSGMAIPNLAGFWMGFLIFVIAGERLELSRVLKITQWMRVNFIIILIVILTGVVFTIFNLFVGNKILGIGMILLSLWLIKNDIAIKNLHHPDLYRFVAVALLAGYFWLGISGILNMFYSGAGAGPYYDAILHTLFIGFVFSMIFGHAPLIFPAILGVAIQFRRIFYLHLLLLHLTLIIRIIGDIYIWIPGRYWGGMLNGVAIAIFLINTIISILLSKK